MFTQDEIAYIRSQKLARIGTASEDGRPDVAAVGFDFDGEYFYISGYANQRTLKYRNTKSQYQSQPVRVAGHRRPGQCAALAAARNKNSRHGRLCPPQRLRGRERIPASETAAQALLGTGVSCGGEPGLIVLQKPQPKRGGVLMQKQTQNLIRAEAN